MTLALTAVLVTCGAAVAAMAGFGFAIATMPFLLFLYPPKEAVALSLCVALGGGVAQFIAVRRHVHWALAGLLTAGALGGVPLGGYVLTVIDPVALKVLIGLAVLVAALLGLRQRPAGDAPARRPHPAVPVLAGFGGGILSTSVGQPGIPVAFLMAWTRLDKAVVRATLTTFFLPVYLWSGVTLASGGLLPLELALMGLALSPFYWLGLFLGDRAFRRFSQATYRRLVLGVLSLAAAVGVVNGLAAIL